MSLRRIFKNFRSPVGAGTGGKTRPTLNMKEVKNEKYH
jgi:hypothetical protein